MISRINLIGRKRVFQKYILLSAIFAFANLVVACSGEVAPSTEKVDNPEQPSSAVQTPEVAGDPQKGKEIYDDFNYSRCNFCHSLDGSEFRGGPTLLGISERAGTRVAELSATEYLRQSILEPSAFIVEGYEKEMATYELVERQEGEHKQAFTITEQELDDLIAFLLTQ